MGHVFVYIFLVAYCGITVGHETTIIEYYTTSELANVDKTTEANDPSTSNFTAPTPPRNLTVLDADDKTISLGWIEPDKKNGKIMGYRIYFTHGNYTDSKTDKTNPDNPDIFHNLTNLLPNTEYKIVVKAFSAKHEGEPSQPVTALTDIGGPSAPKIRNISCDLNSSLIVQFDRPEVFKNSIDYYYINVFEKGILYDTVNIPTEKKYLSTTHAFKNVTPNTFYDVQVSAATRSNRTHRLIKGEKSKLHRIYVSETCEQPENDVTELWAGILAGLVCACVVLILAGGGYLVWKKYFRAPYYYLDNTHCTPAPLDWNANPEPDDEDYSGPIPVELFAEHVQQLHADGDIGFSREYEAIQNDPVNEVNSSENSQHPDNKPKNRYLNIIAYDHSRVQLLPMPGQKISTYINANYIDGFQVNKAYIGTQGPLPSTFDCFWRMIWEQRVTIIVMITNLVERGRRKCDMYWPKDGAEDYGVIQVKLVKEDVMATYTVRTLVIRHTRVNVKNKKDAAMAEKIVYQYHYTNWPDHGTPDHPLPVISFVKKSSAANPPDSGPIVVHCSAGVGRTGTYIVLDAMLKQICTRSEVNIFGFLKHIRAQRNFLVQTEEQYIFIHDALVEAIECGETNISRDEFPKYVAVLQNPNRTDKNEMWKSLDTQYKQVTSFKPRDFNLVSAHKPVNQKKNRCAVLLPVENARVHLTPKPGEDGSDYINASWLPGFQGLREFVITQHPFDKEDFWKMCWDHATQLIIMLSLIDNVEYKVFWPEGAEMIETDIYTCKQINVNSSGTYLTREFLMRSVQDDYEIRVKLVHCHNWPHQGVNSIKDMYDLPNYTISLQKIGHGPICVVDRFGGTEAATFCTLMSLKKHLEYENKVDIYMYAKLYHNKRPGIWLSVDDFMKLHLCIQTICSPPEPYLEQIPPDMVTVANGVKNQASCSKALVPAAAPAAEAPKTNEYVPPCSKTTTECARPSCSVSIECETACTKIPNDIDQSCSVPANCDQPSNIRVPPEETPLIPKDGLKNVKT